MALYLSFSMYTSAVSSVCNENYNISYNNVPKNIFNAGHKTPFMKL